MLKLHNLLDQLGSGGNPVAFLHDDIEDLVLGEVFGLDIAEESFLHKTRLGSFIETEAFGRVLSSVLYSNTHISSTGLAKVKFIS